MKSYAVVAHAYARARRRPQGIHFRSGDGLCSLALACRVPSAVAGLGRLSGFLIGVVGEGAGNSEIEVSPVCIRSL